MKHSNKIKSGSSQAFPEVSQFHRSVCDILIKFCTYAGYIQTPGWDEHSLHPQNMDSVVLVDVPPNHLGLLTLLHLNLTGYRSRCDTAKVTLTVYQGSMSKNSKFWQCGRSKAILRRDYLPPGTSFYVQFRCGNSQKTGFRLHFSIHEQSATLNYAKGFNCSVPYFKDFRLHFPCDMIPQCVDREDEVHCPYTTDTCGPGFVTLGGRCLFYDNVRDDSFATSWRKLDFLCGQRGGRLASLRSRQDHQRLIQYLEPRIAIWGFYRIVIGLHTASLSLPHM